MMLEGLPTLSEYVMCISTVARKRPCGSLALVVYHLLGDMVNAAEHALGDYFPLTLAEPFLQNSSLGSPYQKWAIFTNEDFSMLDACARRVVLAGWKAYEEAVGPLDDDRSKKDAWHWFHSVYTQYASCVVSREEPSLTLSTVSLMGWVEPGTHTFMNVVNRPEPPASTPPIVALTTRDISDRTAIAELRGVGLGNLRELRRLNHQFALWLRSNCTIEELTAPHSGALSDTSLE
ncbi:hypothetical protein WMF20_30900 [Sorangium sp. So ce834]|uniref:hypothetical protein n=1 Tax=Sorangium sp. So ce834 TaxID=3133321 RepID=UPI003F63A4B7